MLIDAVSFVKVEQPNYLLVNEYEATRKTKVIVIQDIDLLNTFLRNIFVREHLFCDAYCRPSEKKN